MRPDCLHSDVNSTSVAAKLADLEAARETHAPNLAGLYRRKVETLREALTDKERARRRSTFLGC